MVIPREDLKIIKKKMIKNNWTIIDKAYLSGFLDGDGSILTQIVANKSYKYKFYIRVSIIFYQSKKNHWYILKLKKMFKPYGYIRQRENMSELIIVNKKIVKEILKELYPYLILKKSLCRLVLNIIKDLENMKTEADFLKVCKKVDETANYTYSNKRKITYDYVKNYLNSPVETSYN